MKKIALCGAIAIASLYGAWQFQSGKTPEQTTGQTTRVLSTTGSTPTVSASNTQRQLSAPYNQQATPPEPLNLQKRFASATDLGAAYREFASLSSNNTEAIYYQAITSLICVNYSGEMLKAVDSLVKQEVSEVLARKRADSLRRLKTACQNMPQDALDFSFRKAIKDAASKGDLKGRAVLIGADMPLSESEYRTAALTAEALAYSRDPIVFDNLGSYFEARDGLAEWQMQGIDSTMSGKEMGAAFRLLACDFGFDCGPTSFDNLAACARLGRCDFRDRVSEYQNNRFTPEAFNKVQRVKDFVGQGLASRTWPADFWSGREKVHGSFSGSKPSPKG